MEWALTAVPAANGKTGSLVFIIDASGDIFTKKTAQTPSAYPYDPQTEGWTKIEKM
jgi:hypothetical protein